MALLVPERADFASWLAHAGRNRLQLVRLADHFVSQAAYLTDPDRHGIEIYRDRPREVWQGRVAERMTTAPLDVKDLFQAQPESATDSFDGLTTGTVIGHVHLRATAIPPMVTFYGDLLGFDLMAEFGSSAAFFGADGYHHHFAANT
mgnify:FL=1